MLSKERLSARRADSKDDLVLTSPRVVRNVARIKHVRVRCEAVHAAPRRFDLIHLPGDRTEWRFP